MSVRTRRSNSDFCKNFVAVDETSCWLWEGALANSKGYGSFFGDRAHRVSYRLYKGTIPSDKHVLHSCDNPSCVNPTHLFLGTNEENIKDKMQKGRYVVPRSMTSRCSCTLCRRETQVASFMKHYNYCLEKYSVSKR